MSYKGLAAHSTSTTLNASGSNASQGLGGFFIGSKAFQALPLYSTMTSQSTITIANIATVPVTVSCQGSSDVINIAGTTVTGIVLQPGNDNELTVGSSGYYATSGAALRQFNALTVAGLSGAGAVGVVGSVRNLVMNGATASASATLTAGEIIVESAPGGTAYKLASFSKTFNLATTGAGGMDTGTAPVSGFVALYAI
ncbi:hypothetical protein [Paraburkholderia bannensis]|uniref:hypothetical protein n=1 Tax=Paraburkholderia bannensis TaxID=765414 RepID=UPI002AC320C6|nr:hypothetical protein [Paraburkholderia bannensis]